MERCAPSRSVAVPCPRCAALGQRTSARGACGPKLRGARQSCGAGRAATGRMPQWDEVWRYLVVEKNFESTSPMEAAELVQSGDWVLVDVRPSNRFEESHPEGAVNVSLYQKTDFSKFNFTKYLRGIALLVNGVEPVELNEGFLEQLEAACGGRGAILYDEVGGTLAPTSSFATGKVSRSLLAAYKAMQRGSLEGKVKHLRGGVYGWSRAELPFVGTYDTRYASRTPSVVEEKQFSYGRPSQLLDDK